MIRTTLAALVVVLVLGVSATAEIYQNIGPFDTLGDVQKKFPNATFEKQSPAWAKDSDALYWIQGNGLSGTIVVKFNDRRIRWKARLATTSDETLKNWISEQINKPDDEALAVEWVRWVPSSPIPLSRFLAKYGSTPKRKFADSDLQPYREWPNGVSAFLSDDEKSVVRVDYEFTDADWCAAAKLRGENWVRSYCKPKK